MNSYNNNISKSWTVFTAVLVILFLLMVTINSLSKEVSDKGKDEWDKTHLRFESAEKAIAYMGDEFRLDRFSVDGKDVYTEYILEHNGDIHGGKKAWKMLSAGMYYGDELYDVEHDYININVCFDDGLVNKFNEDFSDMKLQILSGVTDGTVYEYCSDPDSKQGFCIGRFKLNDFVYFISGNNKELMLKTMEQILRK